MKSVKKRAITSALVTFALLNSSSDNYEVNAISSQSSVDMKALTQVDAKAEVKA
jgi:hypothetical protein